ncbi:MAG: sigma-54-dependent Fis family transcriptional regulator, partial [Spirochaetales bacterium]|nr:sigma-54-dependent Fis family transcriptional regulator [Candidatus Physcosoma equi]
MMSTILVVDDEKNIVSGLSLAFEDEGYQVITAQNGKEAWEKVNTNLVDLVVTDLRMPEMTGDELIRKIAASYPTLPVIVLSGHGTIETAVETMREGAIDFFTKPVDLDKLFLVVRKCLANSALQEQNRKLTEEINKLKNQQKYSKIIGRSGRVTSLMDLINQVAPTKASVLITGESGTGKELVADAVQALSNRSDKPFVKVHCASLSSTLLESELFGHEKGSFTGASSQKKGRFELADGGT